MSWAVTAHRGYLPPPVREAFETIATRRTRPGDRTSAPLVGVKWDESAFWCTRLNTRRHSNHSGRWPEVTVERMLLRPALRGRCHCCRGIRVARHRQRPAHSVDTAPDGIRSNLPPRTGRGFALTRHNLSAEGCACAAAVVDIVPNGSCTIWSTDWYGPTRRTLRPPSCSSDPTVRSTPACVRTNSFDDGCPQHLLTSPVRRRGRRYCRTARVAGAGFLGGRCCPPVPANGKTPECRWSNSGSCSNRECACGAARAVVARPMVFRKNAAPMLQCIRDDQTDAGIRRWHISSLTRCSANWRGGNRGQGGQLPDVAAFLDVTPNCRTGTITATVSALETSLCDRTRLTRGNLLTPYRRAAVHYWLTVGLGRPTWRGCCANLCRGPRSCTGALLPRWRTSIAAAALMR